MIFLLTFGVYCWNAFIAEFTAGYMFWVLLFARLFLVKYRFTFTPVRCVRWLSVHQVTLKF